MASELRVDKIVPTNGIPTNGGGGIIQVVAQRLSASRVSMSGSSFTELGDDAIITPHFSTSKILITMTISIHSQAANTQVLMDVARKIGSGSYTNNLSGLSYGIASYKSSNAWTTQQIQWMDSPNTTQAIIYKLSTKAVDNGAVYLNDNGNNTGSFISLMEISA